MRLKLFCVIKVTMCFSCVSEKHAISMRRRASASKYLLTPIKPKKRVQVIISGFDLVRDQLFYYS